MQIKYKYLIIVFITTTLFACVSSPQFSDIPELSYVGVSKTSMVQSRVLSDSLFLFFDFKDGDGDIGIDNDNNFFDLTITDNRTGEIYDRYKTPFVPEQGASNGVEGAVQLKLFTTCCIYDDEYNACDVPTPIRTNDFTLDIQLVDRAGNLSNVITTEMITLICE